jgi:hypothetical protein
MYQTAMDVPILISVVIVKTQNAIASWCPKVVLDAALLFYSNRRAFGS